MSTSVLMPDGYLTLHQRPASRGIQYSIDYQLLSVFSKIWVYAVCRCLFLIDRHVEKHSESWWYIFLHVAFISWNTLRFRVESLSINIRIIKEVRWINCFAVKGWFLTYRHESAATLKQKRLTNQRDKDSTSLFSMQLKFVLFLQTVCVFLVWIAGG